MEVVLALVTAVLFGFDHFFIRKGLIGAPHPLLPAFITLTVNFLFFLVLSLFLLPVSLLTLESVYLFVIAGILAPGCARAFSYKGLETLGMSITTPIVNSETFFSVTLAFIFLNEPMNPPMVVGILSVGCGLVLLGYETGQKNKKDISKKIRYRYLFYPIAAAIFYGVSVFFRKLGLNLVHSPILGAVFTSGTSWVILAVLLTTSGNTKRLFQIKTQSLIYFIIGGGTTCIAWLSLFYALHIGRVSIVTPIASSYSFFTLFLSYLFLREVERVSVKIVVATILIVGGIVILSLFK